MSLNDQFVLSGDATFQGRVQASLLAACVAISNEGWNVPFHRERANFAMQVLCGINSTQSAYVTLFANSVATDPVVIADATQNGTVSLTTGNRSTQSDLITDDHINSAVASQFNSFVKAPA